MSTFEKWTTVFSKSLSFYFSVFYSVSLNEKKTWSMGCSLHFWLLQFDSMSKPDKNMAKPKTRLHKWQMWKYLIYSNKRGISITYKRELILIKLQHFFLKPLLTELWGLKENVVWESKSPNINCTHCLTLPAASGFTHILPGHKEQHGALVSVTKSYANQSGVCLVTSTRWHRLPSTSSCSAMLHGQRLENMWWLAECAWEEDMY